MASAHQSPDHKSRDRTDSKKTVENPTATQSTAAWLLGLPRRLLSSGPSQEKEEKQLVEVAAAENEWLVVDIQPENPPDMSASGGPGSTATSIAADGNLTPNSSAFRKRVQSGATTSNRPPQPATQSVGQRTNSASGKNPRQSRAGSPHSSTGSFQRKTSSRNSLRSTHLEVQNGGSLKRSVSPVPSRVRNPSPSRSSSSSGTSGKSTSSMKKKSVHGIESESSAVSSKQVNETPAPPIASNVKSGTKKKAGHVNGSDGGTATPSQQTETPPPTLKSSMKKKVGQVNGSDGSSMPSQQVETPPPTSKSSMKKKAGQVNGSDGSSMPSQQVETPPPTAKSSMKKKAGQVNGSDHLNQHTNDFVVVATPSTSNVRSSSRKKGNENDSSATNHVTASQSVVSSGRSSAKKKTESDISANHQSETPSTNTSSVRSNMKKKGILVSESDRSATTTASSQTNHVAAVASHSDSRPLSGSHNSPIPHGKSSLVNGRVSQGGGVVSAASGGQAGSTKHHDYGNVAAELDEEVTTSAFEKVRDTLRISRPKKKKKTKGKLAYSIVVDPTPISVPEVSIHDSGADQYQDPFETSFAENGDLEKKMDHIFKAASIPHNKPEYCDHCGDMAWGLYRQVLRCSRCNFVAHRKCECKVIIGCSLRLEQAILQHDKQVEDVERMAARAEVDEKELGVGVATKEVGVATKEEGEGKKDKSAKGKLELKNLKVNETDGSSSTATSSDSSPTTATANSAPPPSSPTPVISSNYNSAPSTLNSQLLMEKTKLARKIREYNRKTTPVHHIHIKSSFQASDPSSTEYHGFVRVHMHVQRPIHVSTAITRTSWYRLMRPVKERTLNDVDGYDIQTAFYLPLDTNRLVHIQNITTTKELIQILLKKFCVTDNPKKFSLYEEYGSDCRRLFEEDRPLEISLDASVSHRNSKLVLRDNTYSTIQWDAFTSPELSNFIQILQREEELYIAKLTERFGVWRNCIQQSLKEKAMEEQAKKTKKTVSSRLSSAKGKSSPKITKPSSKATPKSSPRGSSRKLGAKAS